MAQPDVPAKCQRTENSSITRSDDIWHDDGSVVLQAEGTQFRVHWSLLSLQSPFFRDVRSLPQPPDQPHIEGCPLIELPDSCTDLQHLLTALYDPLLFKQESLPFPFIAGVVRMGRKYDFKNLLAAAVERLTYENPTTLEEYDRLLLKDGDIRYLSTQITMCHGVVFDTITLAQENQLFAVLPCAYCRAILFYGEDQILDGISSPNSSHVNLCPLDQRACILGSKKMVQAQWEQAHLWDWISSDKCAEGCSDALGCATIKKEFLRAWLVHGLPILMQRTVDLGFCSACEPDRREAMAKGRKELWEKLPSFFDLPPWGELKNDL